MWKTLKINLQLWTTLKCREEPEESEMWLSCRCAVWLRQRHFKIKAWISWLMNCLVTMNQGNFWQISDDYKENIIFHLKFGTQVFQPNLNNKSSYCKISINSYGRHKANINHVQLPWIWLRQYQKLDGSCSPLHLLNVH